MAKNKSRSSNKLVLDIGTSAVRLCELSQTKTGYQLNKYYQRNFEIDPAMDEEAKQDRRATVLGALLKEAKVRGKKAIIAVPGQSVFTRNRSLPPVPEYKVPQIVRYEIQQQIPFSLDEISLDYQVLGRTDVGGYDVMMAAIKVDVVEKQIEILDKVKRGVDIVDVSPLAAYNWLSHTGDFGADGACVAMIDMGATTTDIVIQKDNQFKFTRSLHVGGNDVTTALATAFNMSFLEAERLKCEKAFAPTGNAEQDGKGGEVTGRVLSRLAGEISRSFSYYRSQPGGGPVTRVVISGGGACLRNIIPYLQRQLNIEVRIAQPLAGVAVSPAANEASQFPEQACVVLGLALRCAQSVPVAINLIPPRITEIARRKDELKYWVATFVVIFAIMASAIPKTKNQNEQVKKDITYYTKVLALYDPALLNNPTKTSDYETQMNIIKSELDGYKTESRALDKYAKQRNVWLEELEAIQNARPPRGCAIASYQTVIIGDSDNTGIEGRKLTGETEKSAPKKKPKVKPKPAAGTLAKKGFGAFSLRGGMGMGGLGSLGGAGTTGGLHVSPFPGIGIRSTASSISGANRPVAARRARNVDESDMSEREIRRMKRREGGSSSAVRKVDTNKMGSIIFDGDALAEPNGIAIYGYAIDVETVLEFVELLKDERHFIENGVYFHISSLAEAPGVELDNAQIGALHSSGVAQGSKDDDGRGRGGRRSRREDSDDRSTSGSFGNFRSQVSTGNPYTNTNRVGRPANFNVIKFQIELQMHGKTYEFDDGNVREE